MLIDRFNIHPKFYFIHCFVLDKTHVNITVLMSMFTFHSSDLRVHSKLQVAFQFVNKYNIYISKISINVDIIIYLFYLHY